MLRLSLLKTQEVLSNYIDFNKHTEAFTKYVREKNGQENKRDNDKHPNKNGHELIAEYVLND